MTADELGLLLTTRRTPFLPDEDPAAFWESARRSADDLTPWRRELRVVGRRTGRETWFRVDALGPAGSRTARSFGPGWRPT